MTLWAAVDLCYGCLNSVINEYSCAWLLLFILLLCWALMLGNRRSLWWYFCTLFALRWWASECISSEVWWLLLAYLLCLSLILVASCGTCLRCNLCCCCSMLPLILIYLLTDFLCLIWASGRQCVGGWRCGLILVSVSVSSAFSMWFSRLECKFTAFYLSILLTD